MPWQFTLPDPADPSKPLKMKDGFTYALQVVPPNPHPFQHDELIKQIFLYFVNEVPILERATSYHFQILCPNELVC